MFLIVVYPHRKVSCLMKYSPLRRLSVLSPSIGQCPLIVISLSSSDTDNNYYNIIMSSVFRGWYPKNHLSLDVDLNFTNNMSLQSTRCLCAFTIVIFRRCKYTVSKSDCKRCTSHSLNNILVQTNYTINYLPYPTTTHNQIPDS